jgi:DNA-binding NarL/FixJ family response regulator
MVTDKLKELEAARAKLASLEQSIQAELHKELAQLPAKYGFSSVNDFADALRAASGGGGRTGARPGRPAKRGRPPAAASSGGAKSGGGRKRRTRAVITDETRSQVKKMVEGGKTGAEIAKSLSISLPSVQNIKKALGLVKKR